ncbi:P-II family nitrogen regulator [Ethanoligenens harbinense]|uniref:Nitrogen regulatory protein P-II n=1 Tax=Ethanoligenens harbinense (strain DSM 18485 / JCM 12961 / CGMCC 1.5033 / YUAN-3) TaxID=663278 RepID=E6U589_ETHHY|nr:P-II family nitrogen regulator [Ethanoligenens harbinense]ADU27902.1 nitrogen regulatory protein P-II [Ethanoligenens harbinense YUAN-3]AVQ96931.1 transcriptional regulator [Ethanoligenens harbinense YUAN-3]AYF39592.1 transcriptional regulator [Ethanoligenens harbinense]AYF42418.1 transcriptional regulator [Ethanoligenens harbinense]QCN93171.1 P-II family nitrogen regulator [Ethanoligenens harbinense]
MKKAVVILRPNMYTQTKRVLEQEGFSSFSAASVHGCGKKAIPMSAADNSVASSDNTAHRFVAKKMLIVYIRDEDEEPFVRAIFSVNSTGNAGDGKIFIIPVSRVVRIRTNETDENALL